MLAPFHLSIFHCYSSLEREERRKRGKEASVRSRPPPCRSPEKQRPSSLLTGPAVLCCSSECLHWSHAAGQLAVWLLDSKVTSSQKRQGKRPQPAVGVEPPDSAAQTVHLPRSSAACRTTAASVRTWATCPGAGRSSGGPRTGGTAPPQETRQCWCCR